MIQSITALRRAAALALIGTPKGYSVIGEVQLTARAAGETLLHLTNCAQLACWPVVLVNQDTINAYNKAYPARAGVRGGPDSVQQNMRDTRRTSDGAGISYSLASRLLLRAGSLGMERSMESELLDGHDWSREELRGTFGDMERVNRLLGGAGLSVRALRRLAAGAEPSQPLRILDVGTGASGIPVAMCRWARRAGRRLDVTASDYSHDVLDLPRTPGYPEIRYELADARDLNYPDGSFDIVANSLILHHLDEGESVAALTEMTRVARLGVIVNDLLRNSFGYTGARLLSQLLTGNRLSRHDGPLSVRKAYTLGECMTLCERVGLRVVRVEQFALYRFALTCVHAR